MFRLALRQTEGLIGSIIGLLGLALAVPDHPTLSRRAKTLEVPPLSKPMMRSNPAAAVRAAPTFDCIKYSSTPGNSLATWPT